MASMTIRMTAAHWDATIHSPKGDTCFDFRTMDTDQRRRWYRMFMDSVRAVYGKGDDRPPRKVRRRRQVRSAAR